MAHTGTQLEVEDWIRREWMLNKYGHRFHRERVKLAPGGVFDFDAVSADGETVATISTSGARTASGKLVVGKFQKIRSDMYFLLLAEAKKRLVVLTEKDMYEQCLKEAGAGRVPTSIEFVHVELPAELDARLRKSRAAASKEVSPRRGTVPDAK